MHTAAGRVTVAPMRRAPAGLRAPLPHRACRRMGAAASRRRAVGVVARYEALLEPALDETLRRALASMGSGAGGSTGAAAAAVAQHALAGAWFCARVYLATVRFTGGAAAAAEGLHAAWVSGPARGRGANNCLCTPAFLRRYKTLHHPDNPTNHPQASTTRRRTRRPAARRRGSSSPPFARCRSPWARCCSTLAASSLS